MKKIFFTLLTIAISIQGYSQNMNDNFQSLSMDFDAMRNLSESLNYNFMDLRMFSEWNAGEHFNMGQGNIGNNWNSMRMKFEEISSIFGSLSSIFDNASYHMQETANNFAVFNGSYSSLSGLPTLFDGNFSSLSGTPTTLAGYGITDGFSGNYSDLSGKPTFRDLSSSSPVVFGSLDAFGGTFTNRATIDVIADSNGDLITGYKNGASGDRFNVKLDTADESAIVSSGGGYELKLYSESGEMTFEGMDMDGPVVFSFNGNTEMNGDAVIEGTATADLFIGDGGGLTNLPTPSITFNDLTTKPTTIAGYGITDAFDGSYSSLTNRIFYYDSVNNNGIYSNHGNTATGTFAFAIGSETLASGSSAVSLNHQTAATGNASLAIGGSTQSIGENSFAGGLLTQSTGYSSAALGRETVASGNHSLSIGQGTNSHAFNSMALGQYNSVSSTANPDTYLTTNTAFVIGNGIDDSNRSNAFSVKFDGTTNVSGSVTATSFIGDGSQLTNLPSTGADSPLSYNSNEAGGIEITDYTSASGSRAFAVGNDNLASGSSSTAMGRGTIASGDDSTAIGANTGASGMASTAMGSYSTASGDISTAMGYYTTASGDISTAMGIATTASGDFSIAMGEQTLASGVISRAIGYGTIASGDYSTALGVQTTAEDFMTFAVGVQNKTDETPNPNQFSFQNTAFVIGNGGFDSNGQYLGPDTRSNAFEVLFDGTTTIAGDLNINSDARLKANIISLGSTLSKLLQIDGKSYTMKKDENKIQKIGLLAQDIEKVFPELVSESHGVKSVNYQGLVPILINALKEQDEKMKSQQSQIDELRALVQNLIN